MKIFPIIFALGFTGLLKSQPILRADSINPEYGDRYTVHKGNYFDPGPGGANQVWDFSAFAPSAIIQYDGKDPVGGTKYSYVLMQPASPTIWPAYYIGTQSSLRLATWVETIQWHPGTYSSNDKEDLLRFPFVFQSTYVDTWGGDFTNYGYHNREYCTATGTTVVTYDGFGTLILPTGTLTNVARVHLSRSYLVQGSNGNDQTEEYVWYKNGHHLPVAGVFSKSVILPSFGFYADHELIPLGISGQTNEAMQILFPNPTSNIVNLQVQNAMSVQQVDIYDIQGRLILKKEFEIGEQNLQIHVQTLPEGIYTALVREFEGKVTVNRFTIQH
jgi:hypothetical protein